jgi:5-formyltetrahydrofolate cyclo-ligase
MDKATLRKKFKQRRSNAPYRALSISDSISGSILNLIPNCKQYTHIAAYFPIHNEIDTIPFIQWALSRAKSIYIPRPKDTDTYEMAKITMLTTALSDAPIGNPFQIELWIIPGLAFTEKGARLGRGGGHYDRLLANTPGKKVGVAHYCQKVTTLPQDVWDVTMDQVLFY